MSNLISRIMKNMFKIMMTICFVITALLIANTSMAQTVTANPSSVIMAPGSSCLIELVPANCEIQQVTALTSHNGLLVDSYSQGNKSLNPIKWFLRLTSLNVGFTCQLTIKVVIRLENGRTSEVTITIIVTVTLGADTACLSPLELPDLMLAIKQDEALKLVQG